MRTAARPDGAGAVSVRAGTIPVTYLLARTGPGRGRGRIGVGLAVIALVVFVVLLFVAG